MLARLVRSAGAGAIAAGVDLASLYVMVSLVGIAPRVASVPALLLGNVAMYFGQKHFAFRARGGSVRRELALFVAVQAGGFVLNIALYELVLRVVASASHFYVVTRLVTTNVVWLAYSFPLWHFVFRRGHHQA